MNDTLSSLIAFIGFLIVFSMLIQSVRESPFRDEGEPKIKYQEDIK